MHTLIFVFLLALPFTATPVSAVDWSPLERAFSNPNLGCMAKNIYHEARGESLEGMTAVANVVKNRSRKNAMTLCDVIFKPSQFSWTRYRNKITDKLAYKRSLMVALYTLSTEHEDPSKGALHYHNTSISRPNWAIHLKVKTKLGKHVFY